MGHLSWLQEASVMPIHTRFNNVVFFSVVMVVLSGGLSTLCAEVKVFQETRTVWDGVYTVDQAQRGRQLYSQSCSYCHDSGEAPALVGEAFIRNWFQNDLSILFDKIQTEMPLDNPGGLREESYLEILTFLLEASDFPAGDEPLSSDLSMLTNILVVDEGGLGGPVPNFSLVQVIGCLAHDTDGGWKLTHGTEPVRTREPGEVADTTEWVSTPLGSQIFKLLEPLPRNDLDGHTVLARGFLLREPDGSRLNLMSLQTLVEDCNN